MVPFTIAITSLFTCGRMRSHGNGESKTRHSNGSADNKQPRLLFGGVRRYFKSRRNPTSISQEHDTHVHQTSDAVLVDIDGRRSLRKQNAGEEEDEEQKAYPVVMCEKTSRCRSNQETKQSSDSLSHDTNKNRELTMENGQMEKEETVEEKVQQVNLQSEEIHGLVSNESHDLELGCETQMSELMEMKKNHIRDLNQKVIALESNQQYFMKLDKFREELQSVITYKDELEVTNKKLMDQLKVLQDHMKLEDSLNSSDKFHINQLTEQLEDASTVTVALRQKLEAENQLHKEQMEEMEREYEREVQVLHEEIQELQSLEEHAARLEQMLDNESERRGLMKEKNNRIENLEREMVELESSVERSAKFKQIKSELQAANTRVEEMELENENLRAKLAIISEYEESVVRSDNSCDERRSTGLSENASTTTGMCYEDLEAENRLLKTENEESKQEIKLLRGHILVSKSSTQQKAPQNRYFGSNVDREKIESRSARKVNNAETITNQSTLDNLKTLPLASLRVHDSAEKLAAYANLIVKPGETEAETIERLIYAATNRRDGRATMQCDVLGVETEEIEEIPLEPHAIPKSQSKLNKADSQTENEEEIDMRKEKNEKGSSNLEERLQEQYDLVSRLRAELTKLRNENIELQMIAEEILGSYNE